MTTVATGHRQIQLKSTSIMVGIVLLVTTAAFWTLYRIVLDQTETQLTEVVRSQARLMEAVAKYDAIHTTTGGSRAATLAQVRESHYRYRGFGETGAIVLAEQHDSTIHFLLPERSLGFETPPPVPLQAGLAEPMSRALSGESGVMHGRDFTGVRVVAAYEYLPFLDAGLVARVALSEIRFPFFNAAFVTGGFALLSLLLGSLLQRRIVDPLVSEVFETNEKLAEREAKLEKLSTQLARYLSPPLYKSMFEGTSEARLFTARKKLTVFFSDIVGFTARTDEMEPEDVSHQLNRYFDTMAGVVSKHGGTLDKFIGDAIMVFYGDPESRGVREDAVACVEMAWEMREATARLAEEWRAEGLGGDFRVRTGITSGYCTVGNFGSESRMEYTIIGNQVNLAARIESAAEPGEILLSEITHDLVRDRFECVEHTPIEAKGFRAPVRTFQVVRPLGASASGVSLEGAGTGFALRVDAEAMSAAERDLAVRKLREALEALGDSAEDSDHS